jgi:hypothetical protein
LNSATTCGARADLRQQVETLERIVSLAVQAVDLVDEMREAGELAEPNGNRVTSEVRSRLTLSDLGLSRRRVSEWRSLRDNDALGYLVGLLSDGREKEFEKASVNWLRKRAERISREKVEPDVEAEYIYGDITIRHGDLRTALADLSDVDAVITDPPYPIDYIDEWEALAEVDSRSM